MERSSTPFLIHVLQGANLMRLYSVILVLLTEVIVVTASPRVLRAQPAAKSASLVQVASGETTFDTSRAATPGVTIDKDRLARLKGAKMPRLDRAIPFDTPEADAVLCIRTPRG
jgi:hypothetical protein